MSGPGGTQRGPLGRRIILERNLACAADGSPAFDRAVRGALRRFILGDWGDVSRAVRAANVNALRSREGRILGRYPTPEARGVGLPDHEVVIMTDDRHEMTLVLLSADY